MPPKPSGSRKTTAKAAMLVVTSLSGAPRCFYCSGWKGVQRREPKLTKTPGHASFCSANKSQRYSKALAQLYARSRPVPPVHDTGNWRVSRHHGGSFYRKVSRKSQQEVEEKKGWENCFYLTLIWLEIRKNQFDSKIAIPWIYSERRKTHLECWRPQYSMSHNLEEKERSR